MDGDRGIYISAVSLMSFALQSQGKIRSSSISKNTVQFAESLFPVDAPPRPFIHTLRAVSANGADLIDHIKTRLSENLPDLGNASLKPIGSPDVLFAIVLGAFHAYKTHGVKLQMEWSAVCRQLLVCTHWENGQKQVINVQLVHSSDLRSLRKAAEMNRVQIAAVVYDMKALLKTPTSTGMSTSKRDPTHDEIAKAFAVDGASAGNLATKYKLSSARVVRAYLEVCELLLFSDESFQKYIYMLEKYGPECLFHCGYTIEAAIHGLGEANYNLMPDFLAMIDLYLANGDFTPNKISQSVITGKVAYREVIAGLMHLFLMRTTVLQLLHQFPVDHTLCRTYFKTMVHTWHAFQPQTKFSLRNSKVEVYSQQLRGLQMRKGRQKHQWKQPNKYSGKSLALL